MPEMRFHVRWPDGRKAVCYSPSLVIKDYFHPGAAYPLDEFVAKAREALGIASERVRAKYGFACTAAMSQLEMIEQTARKFAGTPHAMVTVEAFEE
jgi:uncharacterized repeat protein (TIGR04042 family)